MKKIIYSLVAMLFMGSIFTSCLEQTELPGLYQVRLSQAGYLDALAELKKADAAVKQADAAYRQAQAAVELAKVQQENARAESLQALADIEKAKAEYSEADYQAKIDAILDQMAEDELDHQKTMAEKQAELAKAQKALEDALAKIELESLALTNDQWTVVNTYKTKYETAATTLNNLLKAYADTANGEPTGSLWGDLADAIASQATAEYAQELIEEQLAYAERQLAYSEQAAAYWKELLNDFEIDYLAEIQAFKDTADMARAAKAELVRDTTIYGNENRPILAAAIKEANDAYNEAIKEPLATLNAAVKDIKVTNRLTLNGITKDASGKITAVASNAKATADTVKYKANVKKALPAHTPGDLITTYEAYLDEKWENYNDMVNFKQTATGDTIIVTIANTTKAEYLKKVDTVWSVGQSSLTTKNNNIGIWTAYEDFGRDYLYKASTESWAADAPAIKDFNDSNKALYDSLLAVLENAQEGNADSLMMAWYREAMGYKAAIVAAQNEITKILGTKVYKVTETMQVPFPDTPTFRQYNGDSTAIVFSVRKPIRAIWRDDNNQNTLNIYSSQDDIFDTDDYYVTSPSTDWSLGNLDLKFAPSAQDTATVFNAIVDYFKAIAAIDVKAVPYLKFVQFNSNGYAYMDSVRADLMNIDGLKLRPSNSNLVGEKIKYVATYDNKGIIPAGSYFPASDVESYRDALKNVINLYNSYNYAYAGSDISGYFTFVEAYKEANKDNKTLSAYPVTEAFEKYYSWSEKGEALAEWMSQCYTYFGKQGFAGIAEKVFFTYKTFTDPTNVVIFTGLADPGAKPYHMTDGVVDGISEVNVLHFSDQYGFVVESIFNNIVEAIKGSYGSIDAAKEAAALYLDPDALAAAGNNVMEESSLVFELLKGEFIYNLATGTSSVMDAWTALEDVLKEVKAALDKVVTDQDAEAAARATDAANYNAAIKAYLDAEKAAKKVKDDAIKAAQKVYDDGLKEYTDQITELNQIILFYDDMAADLEAAYALYVGGDYGFAPSTTTPNVEAFIWQKYSQAIEDCETWATAVDTIKFQLGELENEEADMYMIAIIAVYGVRQEIEDNKVADAMFWYEYWKAAYEAALELIMGVE